MAIAPTKIGEVFERQNKIQETIRSIGKITPIKELAQVKLRKAGVEFL